MHDRELHGRGSPCKSKSADPDVFLLAPALREPSIGHVPEPASPSRPTHRASRYQPCSALCLDRTTLHVEHGTNVKAPVLSTGRMSSGGYRVRCALPEELPERVRPSCGVLPASWQPPFLFAPSACRSKSPVGFATEHASVREPRQCRGSRGRFRLERPARMLRLSLKTVAT